MINSVLSSIQKKDIIIDNDKLTDILKTTFDLSGYFKSKSVATNQIEYLIDAVIPFTEKFKEDLTKLDRFLYDPDLMKTFEKSPSTTSNVNLRLNIAARYLNK